MKKDQEIDTSFDISHLSKRTPKNGARTERAWYLTWKTAEPCLGMLQPRSQGLSSLPPMVVGIETLVAAGHVTTGDTNFSTGVESTNNFCRSQPGEAK